MEIQQRSLAFLGECSGWRFELGGEVGAFPVYSLVRAVFGPFRETLRENSHVWLKAQSPQGNAPTSLFDLEILSVRSK